MTRLINVSQYIKALNITFSPALCFSILTGGVVAINCRCLLSAKTFVIDIIKKTNQPCRRTTVISAPVYRLNICLKFIQIGETLFEFKHLIRVYFL